MVVFGLMRDLAQKELSEYLDKYASTKVKIVNLQVLSVNQRPLKRYAVLTHVFIVLYQFLQVVTFEFFSCFFLYCIEASQDDQKKMTELDLVRRPN